eukprot:TRINITY_DN8291_c0_g1_i1.p1 TRINITY_DN8291_c0_g1~~TRINITY_DN8291_c0_g1_i1.p1  ORF type:complete len:127 (-),score=29.37 TRINITY_DN8291_c0_g1_i1:114-494(-)
MPPGKPPSFTYHPALCDCKACTETRVVALSPKAPVPDDEAPLAATTKARTCEAWWTPGSKDRTRRPEVDAAVLRGRWSSGDKLEAVATHAAVVCHLREAMDYDFPAASQSTINWTAAMQNEMLVLA